MKTAHTPSKQRGFFSLAIGFGLMVIFGGTAAVVDHSKSGQQELAKPDTEISQQHVAINTDE